VAFGRLFEGVLRFPRMRESAKRVASRRAVREDRRVGRGKSIALVLAAAGLLVFAATATARFLPTSFAYNAALKDARERTDSLVHEPSSYGVKGCARKSSTRVACEVYASSHRYYEPGESGPLYRDELCEWSVVSHYRRGSPLVYYFNQHTSCHRWTTESPFAPKP
jgi:hypothetical protein